MRLLRSELRLRLVSLIGWTVAVAALVVLILAFYPSIRGTTSLDSLYANLGSSAQGLLGGSDVSSPAGYLTTQMFAFFLPAVLLVFGVLRGTAALAGEEQDRTLDLLLAQPVSRRSAYVQKALAVLVGLAVLTAATAVPLVALDGVVGLHLGVSRLLAISVQMGLFCASLAMAAQALSASFGTRTIGSTVVGAYAVISYLVYGLSTSVSWLGSIEPLSLWRWYLGNDPLANGLGGKEVAVLVAVCVVAMAGGIRGFGRRDLRS